MCNYWQDVLLAYKTNTKAPQLQINGHNDGRTHHAAKSLAGPEGPDDQRDVQVRVNPPALIATLQTPHIVLQFALVKLVDQVSLGKTKDSQSKQVQ